VFIFFVGYLVASWMSAVWYKTVWCVITIDHVKETRDLLCACRMGLAISFASAVKEKVSASQYTALWGVQ